MTHPVLEAAADDVRAVLPHRTVDVERLTDGTLWIHVRSMEIGGQWAPSTIDLSVKLTTAFPASPPYPFYASDGLKLIGREAPAGLTSSVNVDGRTLAQISLNRPYDPEMENLGSRFVAVRHWLSIQ